MSGEFLERLKAERPDVDWDAAMRNARERRDRQLRSPWVRLQHRVHAMHPELHREACSLCTRRAAVAQCDAYRRPGPPGFAL